MRSQEEIVREIVKVIKKARPTAAVDETYIRDAIDRLRTPRDPEYRKQNANYAKEVIKWIDNGLKLLAGRAGAFPPALLFRGEQTDKSNIPAYKKLGMCDWWGWATVAVLERCSRWHARRVRSDHRDESRRAWQLRS